MCRAVLKHIIEIILGKNPESTMPYAANGTIPVFLEMVTTVNFLLSVLVAYLFYAAIQQNAKLGPKYKVISSAAIIIMGTEIKSKRDTKITCRKAILTVVDIICCISKGWRTTLDSDIIAQAYQRPIEATGHVKFKTRC